MTFNHKVISSLISLLLLTTGVHGAEYIESYDENTLPVLNDELRDIDRRLREDVNLTSKVTGILPLVNGGTGSALTDPNIDEIFYWDDSAGVTDLLGIGSGLQVTSGSLEVTTEIPVNTFEWVSNTAISDTTATSNIAILQGEVYKMVINFTPTDTANEVDSLILQFNGVEASKYAGATGEGVSASTSINLMTGTNIESFNAGGWYFAEIIMDTVFTDQMSVMGEASYKAATTGVLTIYSIRGWYDNSDTVTYFTMTASNDITGTIVLYKLND